MQIKSLLKQFSMVNNRLVNNEMRWKQERDDILLLSKSTTGLHIFKYEPINVNIEKERERGRE